MCADNIVVPPAWKEVIGTLSVHRAGKANLQDKSLRWPNSAIKKNRFAEILSCYNELLSRYNEILSRFNEIPSRYNEILNGPP